MIESLLYWILYSLFINETFYFSLQDRQNAKICNICVNASLLKLRDLNFIHSEVKIVEAKIGCRNNCVKQTKRSYDEKQLLNEKFRQLCSYDEAPNHLKFNPFIREGYRKELTTKLCVESIFWWTNETVRN